MPVVAGIYVCSARGEPMISVARVMAIEGRGLEGDRYALGAGTYSGKRHDRRDVTLISENDIEAANAALETRFEPRETRRNILVRGEIDLLLYIGRRFRLGSAIIEGFEECAPCSLPSKIAGKPGFEKAYKGLGGLRGVIVRGGIISLNDRFDPVIA